MDTVTNLMLFDLCETIKVCTVAEEREISGLELFCQQFLHFDLRMALEESFDYTQERATYGDNDL